MKTSDIKIKGIKLYFLPVKTRIPLKFGPEVLTSVTCARACVKVESRKGEISEGWGETPLSVQWVWPGELSYETRENALKKFCMVIANNLKNFSPYGHAFELGCDFQKHILIKLVEEFNGHAELKEPLPYLAALVCFSLFDIALHDAYGKVNKIPVYSTYNSHYMNRDLSFYFGPTGKHPFDFKDKYPEDFLISPAHRELVCWHLVGGKDLLYKHELTGSEPEDGYPVILADWIQRDGLKCLKVKLTGTDSEWDYERLVSVGKISLDNNVEWLTADFNCQVTDCSYVNDILDKLEKEYPDIHKMILYIEQPFPYDLEKFRIDVRSVSSRKPLFMDESAHDWHLVKLGYELGWTGVALKTCKTQTGALLSLCWAKAHDMLLMVQDLTNPMLAQIPHMLLAANAGTIMGVETNSMQFYPQASSYEANVHPGIYIRKNGKVTLDTIKGYGFGYCVDSIQRPLSEPVVHFE